jgi:pimeloyl-ACP methyl ester carboxylesterase
MPTTETPTLVLWGSEEKILAVRQAERFGRLMPNARVRVLDGCGHALEYDCPVRVNDQMEAFLDEQ